MLILNNTLAKFIRKTRFIFLFYDTKFTVRTLDTPDAVLAVLVEICSLIWSLCSLAYVLRDQLPLHTKMSEKLSRRL